MNSAEDTHHEIAPFQIVCPVCGRDSDDPEFEFLVSAPTFLEQSECALTEAVCGACKTRLDVAIWPVDGPAILRELGETLAALGPEGVALLDRYLQHRGGYRQDWERLTAEARPGPFGQYRIDLTKVRLAPAYPRLTTVDSRVLAAAQACRGSATLEVTSFQR